MSQKERIATFVAQFPGRDDDEIAKALRIQPRQTVNQACRALEKDRVIRRVREANGKIVNFPVSGRPRSEPVKLTERPEPSERAAATSEGRDWFWEGNVADAVAKHLRKGGWSIVSQADTASKERGIDLHARRGADELLVEVKGYPSKSYGDPRRAAEIKPTPPTSQAGHWYSHALLKALQLRCASEAIVMMAFPDFPRFRALHGGTRAALDRMEVATAFVGEDGGVEVIGVQPDGFWS